ncbi:HD domain-containing protein [Burkholderia guangdongensis]|uniref:HD domain-containing protein n=1 Tax=Burkholderia guangdongensis TaxID=1792500 RepID=UPI0015CBEEC8|nr:HD domain-containing protein [Burkholderia guangdongensis]
MPHVVAGVPIPDSAIARAADATVHASEPEILYRHSMRVFVFASIIGRRRALAFDAELLFVAALFHDVGLCVPYRRSPNRFEVDGANAVQAFLATFGVPPDDVAEVWRAVALHTAFGINAFMAPLTALTAAGVETDLFGQHFDEVSRAERDAVLREWPRGARFKEGVIDAFAEGMGYRPATTFGSVNADVLERCDPNYRRINFCGLILGSNWKE